MELVYLWVEEYKNIKNQGFNFSSKFEFHYDKDSKKLTKVRDESTTNKSIFSENINITAIVGENGSGKSSLFEVLSKILTFNSGLEVFNYFYILNNGSKNICYTNNTNNINILNTDITMEKNIPRQLVDGKLSRGKTNHNIALKKYFDVSYLNISHLERDNIIKNDFPSPEDPIKYYGIYRKNDFDLYKETSLFPAFSGFKLSQFNFYQTYTIGNLLIEDKYKKLFFEVFKIKQPYSIKINYQKEELEKIKISNTPNDDPSRLVDASVPEKIEKILEFLQKINNNLIIESDGYQEFFKLVSSTNDLETNFQLTFQTEEGKDIKLSSGEKTILFYLERIDFMLSLFKDKDNILLFDEIELYLHPNWQKRILKIIFDFIYESELKNNLHIIVASHSPFILSDLPNENVIFLEKYDEKNKEKYSKLETKGLENGNCINVSKDIELKTFGANIHTLLSDGFFMSDGLMGEFAKNKINEIKEFYDANKNLKKDDSNFESKKDEFERDKEYFKNIQKIIGEPFLQTIIKNYLEELEQIFDTKSYKSNKKQELLKQFSEKELEEYLESLKNDKA
jgi:predicted ATP-binding protein involved in virulence